MGMKKLVTAGMACLIVLLTGCSFNTPNINLYDIEIKRVKATVSSAYFLDRNGVLYSTGADPDASSFVVYKDKSKGIVAKDVVDFGEIVGGGYYIDEQNNLYLWNMNDLPLYNYEKGKTALVLRDVLSVSFDKGNMIYIDTSNTLYLVGRADEQDYKITAPKFIAANVESADIHNGNILWSSAGGGLGVCGEEMLPKLDALNEQFASKKIEKLQITNNNILLLADNELWFYGNEQAVFNQGENTTIDTLKLLSTGIVEANGSNNSIIALNKDGEAILWGKCVSNGTENVVAAEYEYLDKYIITDNATSVYISGGCICFVDDNFDSKIYHSAGWSKLYGNSTADEVVGINRAPVTWVP